MARWKVGDIVKHKATGDSLLVLRVVDDDTSYKGPGPTCYTVRLPNYQTAQLNEFELEPIRSDVKIKDFPVG